MPDNRFPSPGTDTRFPSPGADTRFAVAGVDARFPSPGIDTRFGTAPEPPFDWAANSAVYIDATSAPEGPIANLAAAGIWAASFSDVAGPAGSAQNVMTANGIAMNGNTLRWIGGPIAARKITILSDMTRQAPLSAVAAICSVNPTGVKGEQFFHQYRAAGYRVTGPNSIVLNPAPIGGYGDRQVVGAELDMTALTLTTIAADGETQVAAVTGAPINIARIDLCTASVGILHRLAIIVEAP